MTEFAATVDRTQEANVEPKPTVTSEEANNGQESIRVITVRLPASLHEALKDEAHQRKVSMNKLCISKLLQVIEQDLIPAERGGTPERKPQLATATVSSGIGSSTIGSTNHSVHQPQQASPYQTAHTSY